MHKLLKMLKAAGDESRLRILSLLRHHPLCVCEIAEAIGLAQSTVSRHLKMLEESRLLERTKYGQRVEYRLASASEGSLSHCLFSRVAREKDATFFMSSSAETPIGGETVKPEMGLDDIRLAGEKMASILGLSGAPVGVRLLKAGQQAPEQAVALKKHRYCQTLMEARRGQEVLLDAEGIACPAAAAAFGFRQLPNKLQSGDGLVGFGIVADRAVGRKMFKNMPKLPQNDIHALLLFPLEKAACAPDVIIVEDEVEKLMWIVLSALHTTGGERIQSSTAVLQATCVDSTIIPYIEKRLNFSYGCYGCRDATDIGHNETVLGFPGSMLLPIVAHLEFLSQKAIPVSRSKRAWHAHRDQEATACV